jgi:hypothetical protein
VRRAADDTFATKTEAEEWLTLKEAELLEGDWIDPEAGVVLVTGYAATWIEERPGTRTARNRSSKETGKDQRPDRDSNAGPTA